MVRTALQGVLAGLAGTGFVLAFLFAQTGLLPPSVLAGTVLAALVALFAAGGRPALRRLAGRGRTTDADQNPEWWLARVDPALEDSWNAWSDLVLTVALAAVGLGSFGLLVAAPSDDPPLGLLIVGFLGLNGALISLAFAVD